MLNQTAREHVVTAKRSPDILTLNGCSIGPGQTCTVKQPLPALYTHAPLLMPVHVIRGKKAGPKIFVCAAIHGDELNGIEIVRRLLSHSALIRIRGTLLAVPIVNIYGVLQKSRYLPDRRDLNRCFPGSDRGSLAARVANTFMDEIVSNCSYGIDLHTGAVHRVNLPQIRADLDDPTTAEMARAFGVPVLINATLRDGSLRQAATDIGVKTLLYEAGEALRFDEISIRAGVRGILKVMRLLEMLPKTSRKQSSKKRPKDPFIARSSAWIRAPQSGIMQMRVSPGARICKGDKVGLITDPYGKTEVPIVAPSDGLIIGQIQIPLIYEGDAIYHLARFDEIEEVADDVETFLDTVETKSATVLDPLSAYPKNTPGEGP